MCTSLKEAVIGNSVTAIGGSTFLMCYALETVTIGSSVTEIGSSAFMSSSNIKTINILAQTPPTITGGYVFDSSLYSSATLNVPAGTASAYRNAAIWRNFENIKEDTSSGITNVENADGPIVKAGEGYITVENADGEVTVYDLSGAIIRSTDAQGTVEIPVPSGNVYIVKTAKKTVKVAI